MKICDIRKNFFVKNDNKYASGDFFAQDIDFFAY